jgi:hypothetical protein
MSVLIIKMINVSIKNEHKEVSIKSEHKVNEHTDVDVILR